MTYHEEYLVCDHCGKSEEVIRPGEVPSDWILAHKRGYVGNFHVCGIKCLLAIDWEEDPDVLN